MTDSTSTLPASQHSAGDGRAAEMLCDLAVALGQAGTPAHRLEDALTRVAMHLGVKASFFAMPTAVFASFEPGAQPGEQTRGVTPHTRLIRLHSAETNLARLTDLDQLLHDLVSGRVDAEQASRRLTELRAEPARYGRPLTMACFALVGACAARFFGAGTHEIVAASVAGLAVGATVLYAGRRFAPVAEFVAGLIAAVVAVVAADRFAPCAVRPVLLAGLIVLIPGLTLTLAVTELATRNLVAGTARLMGALTTFIAIGFGVAIGQQITGRALGLDPAAPATASSALPDWTLPASLLLVPFPFAVLFKARRRDIPAIAASAFTAYYGALLGARLVGPELGVCVAAMLVGLAANVYARLTRRPAAVPLLPGILLLVPGSIGFESVRSFVAHDALAGVSTAFNMLFVAIAIVAGLLIANASAPSKRSL
ncbi:MAG: threonine/serine exporter family protein [Phycisphaerales bacterium]